MAIYEYEDKNGCPDCHHQVPLYLGASGVDGEGLKVAYRCPNCGMETEDFTVGEDDVIPEKFAWVRDMDNGLMDGAVTWFLEERAEHSLHPTVATVAAQEVTLDARNSG